MKNSVEYFLKPNDSDIANVINKSDQFFKSLGISKTITNKQCMIIDELVKFGSEFGAPSLFKDEMKVKINIDTESIVIEISKSIDGLELNCLNNLDETIQFIRGYQDPFEAFLKMKSKPYNQNCNGENGLRLAKIAYLGDAIVDFFVNEDNMLNLSAVRTFRKENYKYCRSYQVKNDHTFC